MAMGLLLRCVAQCTGLATRPSGHLYVSLMCQFAVNARGSDGAEEFDIGVGGGGIVDAGVGAGAGAGADDGAGVRRSRRYWNGSRRGDAGHRRWHRYVDVLRWRSGRISDCSCRRDQIHLWMVPRDIAREYDLSCLCIQQAVAIVPVVIAKGLEIEKAGMGSHMRCRGTRW